MIRWRILGAAVIATLGYGTAPAMGADPIAESLFQEALDLMRAGDFATACPRLAASHETEPRAGTLVVLASCHEQQGKLATAWAEYREAASLARSTGRAEVRAKALALADAVEPAVPRVELTASEDLTVMLDGRELSKHSLGAAMAIDPGEHVAKVRREGAPWHEVSFSIQRGERRVIALAVPAERPAPEPTAPRAAAPPTASPTVPETRTGDVPDRNPDATTAVPIWVWPVGAAGIVATAAAVAFAVDGQAAKRELDDQCTSERNDCPLSYDFDPARERELRGFGLFVGLGTLGLGAIGASLWGLLDTDDPSPNVALHPTWGGAALHVRF